MTLIDVAKGAGVVASTVSRYMRGGKSVSSRVSQLIEVAIGKLGYVPNTLARGLRVGRSKTNSVLVPHVNNVFFGNALRTIQMKAPRRWFTVMLLMHQEDAKVQQEQLASLKRSRVDGILLIPSAETSSKALRTLLDEYPTQELATSAASPQPMQAAYHARCSSGRGSRFRCGRVGAHLTS